MTPNDDLRERAKVEQVDREAAADYLDHCGHDWGMCADVREGRLDHPVAPFLARHRLAAIEAMQQRVEMLEGALRLFVESAVIQEHSRRVDVDEWVLSKARAALGDDVG